jgi:preprotein translocase subunit SecA
MSLITSILSSFFGTKSEKDIKEIQPLVDNILVEYDKLKNLSNDELRKLSSELKTKVRSSILGESGEIEDLKKKIEEPELDIKEKEKLYNQIDKLNEQIDKKLNDILLEVLPVAFAIVKDTARRFFENEESINR